MIGGVGQRMLVGVSKRMAAEFFGNVETVLIAAAVTAAPRLPDGAAATKPSGASRLPPAASAAAATPGPAGAVARRRGAVFTAPTRTSATAAVGGSFAQGIVVGAAAASLGALVGGWISRRGAWLTSTCTRSAREMAAAVAGREISARELLELHLARIAETQPGRQRGRVPRRGARPGRGGGGRRAAGPRRAARCRCTACRTRSRTPTRSPAGGRRTARRCAPTTSPSATTWSPSGSAAPAR